MLHYRVLLYVYMFYVKIFKFLMKLQLQSIQKVEKMSGVENSKENVWESFGQVWH